MDKDKDTWGLHGQCQNIDSITILTIPENPAMSACLVDRDEFEQAFLSPLSLTRAHVNHLIRTHGMANLGSPSLRRNARYVLNRYEPELSDLSRVVLQRLHHAGLRQPAYAQYIAIPGLSQAHEVSPSTSPDVIAQDALLTAAEVLEFLLTLPQLMNAPDRDRLEQRITAVISLCGELAFGRDDDVRMRTVVDEDPIEHGALLPQENDPMELNFMATTVACEVLFAASAVCVERAISRVVHDQASLAIAEIACAVVLAKPLTKLLGLLVSMSVPVWFGIREGIARPSAIQGKAYRRLGMAYRELDRVIDHPRYPEHEASHLPHLKEVLKEAEDGLEQWRRMHLRIATKYSGQPEPQSWLAAQVKPRPGRQTGPDAASDTSSSNGSPDGDDEAGPVGVCPMGH